MTPPNPLRPLDSCPECGHRLTATRFSQPRVQHRFIDQTCAEGHRFRTVARDGLHYTIPRIERTRSLTPPKPIPVAA